MLRHRERAGATKLSRPASVRRAAALLAVFAVASTVPAIAAPSRPTVPTATSPYAGVPTIAGCPVFPKTSLWNRDVSHDPVDPRSAVYIASIGSALHLHADFGSGRYGDYGIAINVVGPKQRKVPIRFTAYGDESDKGPYPVPPRAHVEGGAAADGDRHVLVVQEGTCKLYELYRAFPVSGGEAWDADSGAVFDLRHPHPRPAGWTSADAAGLPIAPGLARAGEVRAGAIRHALRVTVSRTQCRYVAPARHEASSDCNPDLPPMGLRLRLKASFPLTGYHGQALVILKALKTYGLIVADNGSSWYISGTPDRRWNDDDLDQLKTVAGSWFEVIRSGSLRG